MTARTPRTPENAELFRERAMARDRAKKARRRAKRRADRLAKASVNKTCPVYRRSLPPIPEMHSKEAMRAFITQAVLNTPGAHV